ncbi:MAG: hypothetical protein QNK03_24945 [Myxococcota bacterium]|nr:hypothetical protein [Myxococcota bacterium]
MAAITVVAIWRPKDGRLQEFSAQVVTAKKIHERLGTKVRVHQSAIGGEPMAVHYVMEHASWEDFGSFGAKMDADSEWQKFWGDAAADPTANLLQNFVVNELPI